MRPLATVWISAVALSVVGAAQAEGWTGNSWPGIWRGGHRPHSFQRIATLPNYRNNANLGDETVSEIAAATRDGKTLVYTDGVLRELGFVDILDPAEPIPTGKLVMNGQPTSVSVLGNRWALVAVNTSDSYLVPSGYLAVVDVKRRVVAAELDLGGQPDSIKISPSGRFAVVAIENERDEEVVVDETQGGLPQAPAGFLAIVDLQGAPAHWSVRRVELSGLASYGPEDPEPEFVDVNINDQAVVTLQENNHIVVVDLRTGSIESDFGAGTQTLVGVDASEDDIISLVDTLTDVPREPDGVAWVSDGERQYIGVANEGDLFGGSRGFSLFDTQGQLVYDSGTGIEEIAVRYGHYPESRSENKGTEPESIEYARIGGKHWLFVGSERGSFVAVYEVRPGGEPEFVQLLPAPLAPEGLLSISERGLLIASGESDDPSYGVRSSLMIYRYQHGAPTYPQLLSGDDADGKPIPWAALSGMVGVPGQPGQLLAVWDSYFSESRLLRIDVNEKPAVITSATVIEGGSGNYDPEGIAISPDGSYWVASEGNASGKRPNRLLQLDPDGTLLDEIGLPTEIEECRAASESRDTLGSGFEGVAVATTPEGGYRLLVAQQRGWNYTTPSCEALDDDPDGVDPDEPSQTRIWTYDPQLAQWGAIAYELEPVPELAGWVGLSEITAVRSGFVVIERDDRSGDFAELKTLVWFPSSALDDGVVSLDEKRVHDLLPKMLATKGWISDKPEGLAVTNGNRLYLVTDNDGVDDWSGETLFLRFGKVGRLFQ